MANQASEQIGGPWIGYEAAAKHTDLSETFLRQLVMARKVPFRKIGKRVLFSVPALDQWVSRNGDMEPVTEQVA